MKSRLFSMVIYLAASISGLLVLLYPFFLPAVATQSGFGTYRAGELPAMMTLLLGLCLLVIISEAQGPMANTKLIALLGVLVAINSALRFHRDCHSWSGWFHPHLLSHHPGWICIWRKGWVFDGSTHHAGLRIGHRRSRSMAARADVHRWVGGDECHAVASRSCSL